MMTKTPNPGSPEAIELGCTCPITDNCNGKGAYDLPEGAFYIRINCPLHGGMRDGSK